MAATKPDNAPPLKRRWLALDIRCQGLAWVCGLAAVTNVGFFLFYPPVKPSPDEVEYRTLGVSLAERGELRLPTGEVAKRMPLYPVMIAGLYRWLQPDLWPSGVLSAQTLLSWGAVVLIALTAARLAGPRAGWLAGTVAAFYSPFRLLQVSFLTETLLIFMLLLALYLYITYGIPRPARPAAVSHQPSAAGTDTGAGGHSALIAHHLSLIAHPSSRITHYSALLSVSALLGLAVLTRANALLFLVPFAIDAGLRFGSARRRAARCALILLPALACTGGWAWRNHQLLGAYTLSTSGGLNFHLGNNVNYASNPGLDADTDYGAFDRLRGAGLGEIEADRRLFSDGRSFIVEHPGLTIANALRKTGVWLSPLVRQHGPLTPVLALGMILLAARRARRRGELDLTRRRVFDVLVAAFVTLAIVLAAALWATMLPYTTPLYVVPLGLLSLAVMRTVPRVRGLFIGLLASQWFVAAAFIPLARLRWTVDSILIIAIGAAVSRLCHWLAPPAAGPRACGLGRRVPPTGETRPISDCDSRLGASLSRTIRQTASRGQAFLRFTAPHGLKAVARRTSGMAAALSGHAVSESMAVQSHGHATALTVAALIGLPTASWDGVLGARARAVGHHPRRTRQIALGHRPDERARVRLAELLEDRRELRPVVLGEQPHGQQLHHGRRLAADAAGGGIGHAGIQRRPTDRHRRPRPHVPVLVLQERRHRRADRVRWQVARLRFRLAPLGIGAQGAEQVRRAGPFNGIRRTCPLHQRRDRLRRRVHAAPHHLDRPGGDGAEAGNQLVILEHRVPHRRQLDLRRLRHRADEVLTDGADVNRHDLLDRLAGHQHRPRVHQHLEVVVEARRLLVLVARLAFRLVSRQLLTAIQRPHAGAHRYQRARHETLAEADDERPGILRAEDHVDRPDGGRLLVREARRELQEITRPLVVL